MLGLRQLLASRPRAVLAVLLAFAVEVLSPTLSPAWHRHAGGEHQHVHAGRVYGASPARAPSTNGDAGGDDARGSQRAHRAALRTATPATLHFHVPHPIHLAAAAPPVVAAARAHVTTWHASPPTRPGSTTHRAFQARGPPPSSAA